MGSGSHFRRYALRLAAVLGLSICVYAASEHRGEVRFGEVRVPGAMVLAILRAGEPIVAPAGKEMILEGDLLAVAGSHEAIVAARALIEGPGA